MEASTVKVGRRKRAVSNLDKFLWPFHQGKGAGLLPASGADPVATFQEPPGNTAETPIAQSRIK